MVRYVLVCLVASSCYTPSFLECATECGVGGACPDGTTCSADGFCHASVGVVCSDGKPNDAMCDESSDCQEPPPSVCVDATTLRTFAAPGNCEGFVCSYEEADEKCDDACVDGECVCTTQCEDVGADCGSVETACGELDCGTCSSPLVCGGPGVANVCGTCDIAQISFLCPVDFTYLCGSPARCFAEPVNCNSSTMCPDQTAEFACPCGFVVDCEIMDCVPADGSPL